MSSYIDHDSLFLLFLVLMKPSQLVIPAFVACRHQSGTLSVHRQVVITDFITYSSKKRPAMTLNAPFLRSFRHPKTRTQGMLPIVASRLWHHNTKDQ